jgi:hypothetical protein
MISSDPVVKISHFRTCSPDLFFFGKSPKSGLVNTRSTPKITESLSTSRIFPSSLIFSLLCPLEAKVAHLRSLCPTFTVAL